jgi:hypothetical protein
MPSPRTIALPPCLPLYIKDSLKEDAVDCLRGLAVSEAAKDAAGGRREAAAVVCLQI